MSNDKKLTLMVQVLLLLLCLVFDHKILVEASIRSGKIKTSIQNEGSKQLSSNRISSEEKSHPEEEQLYYLPMQTEFGVTETLAAPGGFSTTSPPHLTINPAPIQTIYQQSTSIYSEDTSVEEDYYSGPYQSHCVSETPVHELESHLLFPSKDLMKESVIMAGHLEIASKTSSVEEVSEIENIVSQPSFALHGTILHPHTMTDL